MKKMLLVVTLVAVLVLCVSTPAQGDLINFESVPGVGVPTEGLVIGTQYLVTDGVSFSLEGGGSPVIAQVGYPETAFSPGDTPLGGQGVGQFFLTDDGKVSGNPKPLLISYENPTAGASGMILDIDCPEPYPEIYTIEARDASDGVLESLTFTTGDTGTGDQLATTWSFDHATADIYSIRIVAFREGNRNVGLAFDNFNTSDPTIIPIPGSVILGSLGLSFAGWKLRRRKTS